MVPYNNYDFSEESWLTALTGVTKLAVILVAALCLIFFMFMVLWGDNYGTECPEENSIENADCMLPE